VCRLPTARALGLAVSDCRRSSWLGGRDSNPDNVVQRAVNVFRYALVRSVLLRPSPPAFRFALVRSGLFLCRMSHCVSGSKRSKHLRKTTHMG